MDMKIFPRILNILVIYVAQKGISHYKLKHFVEFYELSLKGKEKEIDFVEHHDPKS